MESYSDTTPIAVLVNEVREAKTERHCSLHQAIQATLDHHGIPEFPSLILRDLISRKIRREPLRLRELPVTLGQTLEQMIDFAQVLTQHGLPFFDAVSHTLDYFDISMRSPEGRKLFSTVCETTGWRTQAQIDARRNFISPVRSY